MTAETANRTAQTANRRPTIDEFDTLERWYQQAKPKIDRHKALEKLIQSWYADDEQFPPAEPIRAEGTRCYVDLSPRKEMRRITSLSAAWRGLKKAMGLEQLIDSITITFKLLDHHIPEADQAAYVVREPTGPRTIEVVAKDQLAKTAA